MALVRACAGSVLLTILSIVSAAAAAAEPYRLITVDGAHVRWPHRSADGTIVLTYAFIRSDTQRPAAVNCRSMTSPDRMLHDNGLLDSDLAAATEAAFARWKAGFAIDFVRIDEPSAADIMIGAQGEPKGIAFADLELGPAIGPQVRAIKRAGICLNPQTLWTLESTGRPNAFDLAVVISHEIGHALGLDHPSARGHLMSFRYQDSMVALSDGDVRGLHVLYEASLRAKRRAALPRLPAGQALGLDR